MRPGIAGTSGAKDHTTAARLAREGLERIERMGLQERRNLRAHAGSRLTRQAALRRIHAEFGENAIGYAHDEDCRNGLVGYLTTMRSASLYKGVGVVSAQIDLNPAAPTIRMEERLEALIDIHIMKRLYQRAGAQDLQEQMRLCMPAIGWCVAANMAGLEARFVVPTLAGLWFCRREPLPDKAGQNLCGPVSRIVTFCAASELNATQRRGWTALMDAGVDRSAPLWPKMPELRSEDLRHLCAMVTAGMAMRNVGSCVN